MRIDDGRLIHEVQAGDVASGAAESPHPRPLSHCGVRGAFQPSCTGGFPLALQRERG